MDSDSTSTVPSSAPGRRAKRSAVPVTPLKRFVVVDATDGDGEVRLASGGRGTLLASFHSGDLARALARGERTHGRTVVVFDSKHPDLKRPPK
jgi:hypothetical protein